MEAARDGGSFRDVGRWFGTSHHTVALWVARAAGRGLDDVDWEDQAPRGRAANRTADAMEQEILRARRLLREHSDLGEFGAAAIRRELSSSHDAGVPSIRTIGRVLERHGALDRARRTRRPAPARGWYLPAVARLEAELDSFDVVEGLRLEGQGWVEVLTGISLHGGLSSAWPAETVTSRTTQDALVSHWRAVGLPAFVQFDNDMRFQGSHLHPEALGRVVRLCLGLGVAVVFAPPREYGFQAQVEHFNGLWQAKVWSRFHHLSRGALQACSDRYVAAHRARSRLRIDAAPARRPFPQPWTPDLQRPPSGRMAFLRRTSEDGHVRLFGRVFAVSPQWGHRLVRGDVDIDAGLIQFHALRRAAPDHQPLLAEAVHRIPHRPIDERDPRAHRVGRRR